MSRRGARTSSPHRPQAASRPADRRSGPCPGADRGDRVFPGPMGRAAPPRRPRAAGRTDHGAGLLAQRVRPQASVGRGAVLGGGDDGRRRDRSGRIPGRRPVPLPPLVDRRRRRDAGVPGRAQLDARPRPTGGDQPGLGMGRARLRLRVDPQPPPHPRRVHGPGRRARGDGRGGIGLRILPVEGRAPRAAGTASSAIRSW